MNGDIPAGAVRESRGDACNVRSVVGGGVVGGGAGADEWFFEALFFGIAGAPFGVIGVYACVEDVNVRIRACVRVKVRSACFILE